MQSYGNIIKIEEKTFGNEYEGVVITTDETEIRFGISNDQSCCESWGFISCEEQECMDMIGAEVRNVVIVDDNLHSKEIKAGGLDCGGVMFLNVETTKGTLQFACYNSHNGYYGHEARLEIGEIVQKDFL